MKNLETHIVQADIWAQFKTLFGTPALKIGDLNITKHKIPFLPYYVGYCPRVNFFDQKFGWNELKQIAKANKIAFIRFDVPNITTEQIQKGLGTKLLNEVKHNCKKSPRSTFAKWNIIMDISKSQEELIAGCNQKTRYNIRIAAKKGVTTKIRNDDEGFEIFYDLLKMTSRRQKYLIHPKSYYKKLFELLKNRNMANILVNFYEGKPLAAWMILNYKKTLYYPYGGSSDEHRNTMASNLLAWESIKFGKSLGCEVFDMWGATNDPKSTWWGFTKFKLGYGGDLVEYIDSYDFVVNGFVYWIFNFAYNTFWNILKILRGQ